MTTVNAPAPANPELVIRKINEQLTIFSVPFARGGFFPIGGRSTAVTLKDRSIWLIPSSPLDPATLNTLQELASDGPGVQHLVAPDLEHHLFLSQYIEAFPQAKVYVPKRVKDNWTKSSDQHLKSAAERIHFVFGLGQPDPFEATTGGEIKSVDFAASHVNEDIAFLHVPTRTLIQADLMFNLPPTEQYSKSNKRATLPILTNMFKAESNGHKRMLSMMLCKDTAKMTECAKQVSAWDFDRIIPCHGDVIETGGKGVWNTLYARFLTAKK